MLLKISRAFRALLLGLWLGGIVMAFVTASVVFHTIHALAAQQNGIVLVAPGRLPSEADVDKAALDRDKAGLERAVAGRIVGAVLHAGGTLKTIVALLALVLEASIFFSRAPDKPMGWRRCAPALLLILAMQLLLVSVMLLEPKLLDLQQYASAAADNPFRQQFSFYHGLSMALLTLEGLLVALALIIGLL